MSPRAGLCGVTQRFFGLLPAQLLPVLEHGGRRPHLRLVATFSRVGVKAGTEKRFQVLRIAPAREDSEISNI